ncbi:hypothetical protein OROHE_003627 [Orobanche hederae]
MALKEKGIDVEYLSSTQSKSRIRIYENLESGKCHFCDYCMLHQS